MQLSSVFMVISNGKPKAKRPSLEAVISFVYSSWSIIDFGKDW